MNVTTIELDKEIAIQKYKEYLGVNKRQKAKEYSAARRAYRALSKGLKVIDIYAAFEKTGLKSDGSPKLAIVRADAKTVYFTKEDEGAGRFKHVSPRVWGKQSFKFDVNLPVGTFPEWERTEPLPNSNWMVIKQKELETNVPFVPAHIAVPGKLENYYILFEVMQWKATASVKDPYLLQRLNDNTFIVLAEWDLTEVEKVVMRGQGDGNAT